jgi:hypothetical protein
MAALAGIGADQAVHAVSFSARAVALLDAQGRRLGHRPIEGPARSLTRAALYRALQELATTRGIAVHRCKRMTGASSDPDGVEVGFADGSRATAAAIVIPPSPAD